MSWPLQRLATSGSVFLLQALHISVRQEGNVVVLGDNMPMAVAEACSGLRMLMAFVIIGAFIAFMIKRPRWQKAVVVASSIPVAVVCNILRIVVTAVLMLYVGRELGETFFHDLAGYFMTAVAVLLLFGEISLMDRLVLPSRVPAAKEPARRGRVKPAGRKERTTTNPDATVVLRRRRPAESTG
jgi:exosortase